MSVNKYRRGSDCQKKALVQKFRQETFVKQGRSKVHQMH